MRPEKPGVRERTCGDGPVPPPGRGEQQARHDERVRGRERAQERRDQPAHGALLVGVEDPVLGEAGEAAIGEAELLGEPVGHAGVSPPLERYEVDVDQPPGREPAADGDDRQRDPAPPDPVERDEAARARRRRAAGGGGGARRARPWSSRRRRATTGAAASRGRPTRRTRARGGRPRRAAAASPPPRPRPRTRRPARPPSTRPPRRARCRGPPPARGAPSRGCGAPARRRGRAAPRGGCGRSRRRDERHAEVVDADRHREQRAQVGRAEEVVLLRPGLPDEVVRPSRRRPRGASGRAGGACAPPPGTSGSASSGRRACRRAPPRGRRPPASRARRRARSRRSSGRRRTPRPTKGRSHASPWT